MRKRGTACAGVPITDVDGIVIGIVVFNLIAALLPAKGKLVLDEEEVTDNRKKGSLQDPKVNLLQPKKFFGISGFGFTKVRRSREAFDPACAFCGRRCV